jgi:hypothetical protein
VRILKACTVWMMTAWPGELPYIPNTTAHQVAWYATCPPTRVVTRDSHVSA